MHRRVQLLVGHLDRSGLFGGGSTVACMGRKWGCSVSSASRSLRAHKVALDGRWPSLPWGGLGCIVDVSQGTTGKAHRENASRESVGRAQRATWAQATRSRGETSAGPKQAGGGGSTVQSAGVTGGPSEATARQGRAGQPRNTGRGEQG